MIEIINCDQNSPEWYQARLGLPTASEFATICAKGKSGGESVTRRKYMLKLAGEIITREPAPQEFTSASIERGKIMEDEARDLYAFMTDAEPERVGFIRNGQKGCSPDALIGASGGLEIKTCLPHIQIDRLLRGELPAEHRAQVQGSLWVAEREWWDFVSFWPRLPLFVIRVYRDDGYIATLSGAVNVFNEELAETVERVRRYGQPDRVAA